MEIRLSGRRPEESEGVADGARSLLQMMLDRWGESEERHDDITMMSRRGHTFTIRVSCLFNEAEETFRIKASVQDGYFNIRLKGVLFLKVV